VRYTRSELAIFFTAAMAPFYARATNIGPDEAEKTTLAVIFAPLFLAAYRKLVPIARNKVAKLFGLEKEWAEVKLVKASLILEDGTPVHPASYWRGNAEGIKTERFAGHAAKGD
jgi:hypothetical protein